MLSINWQNKRLQLKTIIHIYILTNQKWPTEALHKAGTNNLVSIYWNTTKLTRIVHIFCSFTDHNAI